MRKQQQARSVFFHLSGAAVMLLALVATVGSGWAADFELVYEPNSEVLQNHQPRSPLPVEMILDDGSAEGDFGVSLGGAAQQFLWFNRFTPTYPLRLEEVWVLFSPGDNMAVGNPIELVVYHDSDGDPSNGANLLTTYSETIKELDGATFSIYNLSPPLTLENEGDILIGVVDRFVTSGVTSPTLSAAIDTTSSQGRSWLAVWDSADPPHPPNLPADGVYGLVDTYQPGNWMIRAFASEIPERTIPTLGWSGLFLLALLLAVAGALVIRRM